MWGLIIFADDIDTFVFEDDKNATFSVAVDGWCDTGVCTKATGGCRCGDNDSCGWCQCDQQRWKLYDRLLRLFQVRDTVFLISKLLNIKEVVVFGHGQRQELPDALKKQLEVDKKDAQLAAIDPSSGNLLSLLAYLIPKKWRKNSKEARRKRLKQILENY